MLNTTPPIKSKKCEIFYVFSVMDRGWKSSHTIAYKRYLRSVTISLPLCSFEMRFVFSQICIFFLPFHSIASLQASFSYPLQEGMPFDYPCNAYGNNNSTNHNHNTGNSIHVNSSIATGLGELSMRTTFHYTSTIFRKQKIMRIKIMMHDRAYLINFFSVH